MKSKTSLILMEQLLMLLAFSLAAALCLSVFARAAAISAATARREDGAFLAQNAAQLLKSGISPESLELPEGYAIQVQPRDSGIAGLATGTITVFWEGQPVFSLDTGWQEELP